MIKKNLKLIAISTIFFGIYLAQANKAHAQYAGFNKKISPAPIFQPVLMDKVRGLFKEKHETKKLDDQYYIHDDETFKKNTRNYHIRPFNKPQYEFDISLPTNWVQSDISDGRQLNFDNTLMGDIAHFESEMIGIDRVNVIISLQSIEHEITAENWLKNYLFLNSFTLQGLINSTNDKEASAYYTNVQGNINLYTYISVTITGNTALVARFEEPLKLQEHLSYFQKKSIDSISLSYKKNEPIEPVKTAKLLNALSFEYPISWYSPPANLSEANNLSVQLQNINYTNNTVNGFIQIISIKRSLNTDIRKEIENQKEYVYKKLNLDVDQIISSDIPKANDRFIFKRQEVYEVSYKGSQRLPPYLYFVVLGDKEWYTFIYMLTPRENTDFYSWARNTYTFKQIISTVR